MPPVPVHNSVSEWFRRWRSPLRKFLVGRGVARVADLDDDAQNPITDLFLTEGLPIGDQNALLSHEVVAMVGSHLHDIRSNLRCARTECEFARMVETRHYLRDLSS